MRKFILAAAAMLAVGSAMADLVASNSSGDELRLMPTACVHGGVLGLLKEEYRPQFKKAQAIVSGKLWYACWIDTGEGSYVIVYEDGDMLAYPVTSFIDKPGV